MWGGAAMPGMAGLTAALPLVGLALLPRPGMASSPILSALPDPFSLTSQGLTFALGLLVMFVLYRYREQVVILLTGDDRVHGGFNDFCWFCCFKCCNLCTGEWTRCLSSYLCFWHKGIAGKNLNRLVGQTLGFVPIPVQVSNIVVGDLPKEWFGRGHYYVQIEVGDSPPQTTSVAEDADPKVVQFDTSTFLLRVKDSSVESPVRFRVMELNTLGHKELCECFITSKQLLAFADPPRGPMRFKMDHCSRSVQSDVPSWILMEFTLEIESGSMHHFDLDLTETCHPYREKRFNSAAEFKDRYSLVDARGSVSMEPRECFVEEVEGWRRAKNCVLGADCGCFCGCFCLLLMIFIVLHFYSFICYRGFVQLLVLEQHRLLPTWDHAAESSTMLASCGLKQDPVSAIVLEDFQYLAHHVHKHVHSALFTINRTASEHFGKDLGLGLHHDDLSTDVDGRRLRCNPEVPRGRCRNWPGQGEGEPRPMFSFGDLFPLHLRCITGTCEMHRDIEGIRRWIFPIIAAWAVTFFLLRHYADNFIAKKYQQLLIHSQWDYHVPAEHNRNSRNSSPSPRRDASSRSVAMGR